MDAKTAALLADPAPGSHIVYPYTDQDLVVGAVGHYASSGLAQGDGVVLIVTEEHRLPMIDYLKAETFNVDRLESRGQLALYDADLLLEAFMLNGLPDAAKFMALAARVMEQARRDVASGRHRRVRLFGEMVSLLWHRGNHAAALRLEELWNDIVSTHEVALLCTYELDGNGHSALPGDLIDQHSHYLPA